MCSGRLVFQIRQQPVALVSLRRTGLRHPLVALVAV
jgi:hypothetical protein